MRVAVIGAGISGIRTCESLLRRGCSVTLLESASGPTQGLSYAPGFLASAWAFHPAFYMKKFSSFRKLPDDSVFIADGVSDRMRNRAFLTGAGQSAANPAFAENLKRFEAFVQASDAGTRKLHAEFGIADGRIDGSLMLLSEAETALMRETFPDRELLSREATLERFPLIDPSLAFAASLLIPEDSTFNATFAAKLLLQRIAEKYGPRFTRRYRAKAQEIIYRGGRAEAVAISGNERILCDAVVLASAGGALPLISGTGFRAPLTSLTGFTLTLELSDSEALPALTVASPEKGFILSRLDRRLRATGRFFLGSPAEKEKKAECNRLYDAVMGSFENLRSNTVASQFWSGEFLASPDRFPLAGPVPGADNVILNIAHGPFGLAGAGESAEIAAASALGEDPGEFAAFCSPGRFAEK